MNRVFRSVAPASVPVLFNSAVEHDRTIALW